MPADLLVLRERLRPPSSDSHSRNITLNKEETLAAVAMNHSRGDDDSALVILASDVRRLDAACASFRADWLLYRHAVVRLRTLHDVMGSLEASERRAVARDLETTVSQLLHAVEQQRLHAYPLHWIATSQRAVAQVCQAHTRINALYEVVGVGEAPQLAGWRNSLNAFRLAHERWLEERLEISTDAMIFNDVPSEAKRRGALATLRNQLDVWPTSAVGEDTTTISKELKMSSKLADLMRRTIDRIGLYSETRKEEVHAWFVLKEDVEISKTPFKMSSFGGLHRGTWFDPRMNKQRDVVVKKVNYSIGSREALDDSVTFAHELTLWWQMKHKHILELVGGNHLSRPKFFMTEYATEESFIEFFVRHEGNRKLLWRLFLQVVEGLQFLHHNNTEHGRLKCSNILLTRLGGGTDEDLVVKLSIFSVAINRADHFPDSSPDHSFSLNYEAPERVLQLSENVDYRCADIFSLGVCVIEAATGELPLGMMDDEEIISMHFNSESIDRPDEGFTDDEWALVAKMCDPDPSRRPTLDQVMERMRELDIERFQG